MTLLIVLLGACNGCQPKIPNPSDDPRVDTSDPRADTRETGADSAQEETGPPARCDREELEPNSPPDGTEALDMELWACGIFGAYTDFDSFRIEPRQAGWIKIQVESASRGSPANPQLIIDGGGESAQILDGYLTTDPLLVFPADAPEPYTLTLGETNFLYGEDYAWYMLTSLAKAPVEWTVDEVEPDDGYTQAQALSAGDVVFGTIRDASDLD